MMEKKKENSRKALESVTVMPDDIKKLLSYFQKEQVSALKYDIWYYISVFHSHVTNLIRIYVYASSWTLDSEKEERTYIFEEKMSNESFLYVMHNYLEFINRLKLNYKHKKK